MEHPVMPADVVIVGAGPAGLSCALRLAQLIDAYNAANPTSPQISKENIYLLEKGREVGAHLLSGAVMDPRGLEELLPGATRDPALGALPVNAEEVAFLTAGRRLRAPIIPPPLENHGNVIVSVQRLGRWLGAQVEAAGISVFPAFAGRHLLFRPQGAQAGGGEPDPFATSGAPRVFGVRTDDKGIGREGVPRSNFEPGYDLPAPITVLAEGVRGSLTKELLNRLPPASGGASNGGGAAQPAFPQVYSLGVKELWQLPAGRFPAGRVEHSLGWPHSSREYGGSWIYGLAGDQVSIGLVTALEYRDPATDPHDLFQRFKMHPTVRQLLEGGEMLRYGAKAIPMGGWNALPPLAGPGWLLIGDTAGFLNSQRLKGIHLAIKSGLLAAEAVFAALREQSQIPSADAALSPALLAYPQRVRESWIHEELWPVRNFHQGFDHGLWAGLVHAGLQLVSGGADPLLRPDSLKPGHERMEQGLNSRPLRVQPDDHLTFSKLTDVYHSGTRHNEDQPSHLLIADLNICNHRCPQEFGNPCQYYCPAQVYEMQPNEQGEPRLHLNPSNCVHCKTCDIMDPYQIVTWVPPEGGGGPGYEGM